MTMQTSIVNLDDDLDRLVTEINQAHWDDANDMCSYDVPSLVSYLQQQDSLFVCCYDETPTGRVLLGIASCRFQLKPYDHEKWLYIDEVDVCADQRKRGAGAAIMKKLIELAEEANCIEVWLGTEVENVAANALYTSLKPDEVAQFVGYTYELDE